MGLLLRTVDVSSCSGSRVAQSALNASLWKKKKGNPKSKLLSLSDSLIRPLALWMSRREAFLSNVQRVMQKSERILNKHCFIDGALARTSVPQFLILTRVINLTTFAYICNHKHFMIFFVSDVLNLQKMAYFLIHWIYRFYFANGRCVVLFFFLSSENAIPFIFFWYHGHRLQHPTLVSLAAAQLWLASNPLRLLLRFFKGSLVWPHLKRSRRAER